MSRVCELFGETIRNVFGCCFLLNVKELFNVGGDALLDIPCMVFQIMCVLCLSFQCASKCSFHMFVYAFVCPELSPHLRV